MENVEELEFARSPQQQQQHPPPSPLQRRPTTSSLKRSKTRKLTGNNKKKKKNNKSNNNKKNGSQDNASSSSSDSTSAAATTKKSLKRSRTLQDLMFGLEDDDKERATAAFRKYDVHQVGKVKVFMVPKMLEETGFNLSQTEVFNCCEQLRDQDVRQLTLGQYLEVVQRIRADLNEHGTDLLGAFVACGGAEDGTGEISTDALAELCQEFGVSVDTDELNDQATYEQLQAMVAGDAI